MKVVEKIQSVSDESIKYLWELDDTNTVETVFLKHFDENHLCISSQVGCNLHCKFCETGKINSKRNVTSDEIYKIVALSLQDLELDKFDLVSFSGMGEPLLNTENVRVAVRNILIDQLTNDISISTAGIIPEFKNLEKIPVDSLFVSLHATNDEARNVLMPINKKYPIAELVKACLEYHRKTENKIFISYMLLSGINDTDEDIERIKKLFDPTIFEFYIRVYNTIENIDLVGSEMDKVIDFNNKLLNSGFTSRIMKSKGGDIYSGCGQLQSKRIKCQ